MNSYSTLVRKLSNLFQRSIISKRAKKYRPSLELLLWLLQWHERLAVGLQVRLVRVLGHDVVHPHPQPERLPLTGGGGQVGGDLGAGEAIHPPAARRLRGHRVAPEATSYTVSEVRIEYRTT